MPIARHVSPRVRLLRGAGLTLSALLAAAASLGAAPAPRFTIQRRAVNQDQGGWRVDYRLRYDGPSALVLGPAEVEAKLEAWVSNSRVASHAVPRWSALTIAGSSGLSATADVIAAPDDAARCRERVCLAVWTGEDGPAEAPPAKPGAAPRGPALTLAPGGTLFARLRWEHQHVLYGDYDPLLGQRALELRLGPATVRDVLPMDQEHYLALPKPTWPAPPDDRRDTRHFHSPPDSLHLEAHVPGNQSYRFPDRPVRYRTKMRLGFWYLVAPGTEGECRVRIAQYKDTPTAWRALNDGGYDECLTTIGRWVKVERVFRTEADATTLALDFRITSADVGELWVDDITLEPVGAPPSGP
jgi:hypothetical protein